MRGTTVIVSVWEKKPVIDAFAMVLFEKQVLGAVVYEDGDFTAVIDAIVSGKSIVSDVRVSWLTWPLGEIQPRPMITSKIRMDEVVEKGFQALINEKDKHVKILVDISA